LFGADYELAQPYFVLHYPLKQVLTPLNGTHSEFERHRTPSHLSESEAEDVAQDITELHVPPMQLPDLQSLFIVHMLPSHLMFS